MIVSNNVELAEKCRFLSTQAKTDSLYFIHDEIGYNYRLTNIQAAMGIAQLENLNQFIEIKQKNYKQYQELGINLLSFKENIFSNHWFYSFLTNESEERDSMIKYLDNQNIQTRPIRSLIHKQKPYLNNQYYEIEKAVYYQERIVNIPCSTNLLSEDLKRVVESINKWRNDGQLQ